jgi:hypothetical protein
MKDNIISHQITTDVVTCFNVQFVIVEDNRYYLEKCPALYLFQLNSPYFY